MISFLQTVLQVTYHYNNKNNRCLRKLTNIQSSYRYSVITSNRMSGIFTERMGAISVKSGPLWINYIFRK